MISSLNEKQKEVIKEIGFGSFWSLNVHGLPLKIGKYPVKRFSAQNSRLKLEEESMDIDKEEARLVLRISWGPELVEEMNNSDVEDEKYIAILERFKNKFGELGPIVIKTPIVVLGQATGGDYWNNKKVNLREKNEKEGGGFGRGRKIVDQMKDAVMFSGITTLSFMELFVRAKDHNINMVEIFNRANKPLGNVRGEHSASSSKGATES
ncbi:hypothetical protein M9H77_17168 [Catharanthus roseus]|uniref:Uncharacterized protein n=1 Tax=Catharanthus roseus TaxID=4058 RepID=A0ACC0B3U1_CATRO|nr:hypothetical protein M9H77_17168 [Catharanthus roseus]